MLNQLASNISWGQRGNFLSIPTDTPARDERLGWTGDINVFAPTASYLRDTRSFLQKWTADLRDSGVPTATARASRPSAPSIDLRRRPRLVGLGHHRPVRRVARPGRHRDRPRELRRDGEVLRLRAAPARAPT